MAVLGEQLRPHLYVLLFHAGQLDVDVLFVGIALLTREGQVEKGGVGFVLPVMEPYVDIGLGHAANYYAAKR